MSLAADKPDCRPFDVVVAGAGLIGAASACLFAHQGLKVALVEAQPQSQPKPQPQAAQSSQPRGAFPPDATDARVSAINLAVGNLFTALGVWSRLNPKLLSRYHAMKVWDRNSAAKISFRADEVGVGEACLGYIIENRVMRAAMLAQLQQSAHATVLHNTAVTGIQQNGAATVTVTLSDQQIVTRLLVGADGCHSRVRELCGISTQFFDFAQDAIVATLSAARGHRATAWQCFLATGPVAMLPLADARCALVWSCDRERADALMQLNETEFCARLQPLFLSELGALSDLQPRRRFPIVQHHASRYIADSVALVGDAAHSLHPLAGLGANLGFMDAAALAEVVGHAHRRGRHIGQYSVLRRYERWRQGNNALVLAMMRGFKEIFGSRWRAAQAIRSGGMNLVDASPALKAALAKFAGGEYGDIPLLCRRA